MLAAKAKTVAENKKKIFVKIYSSNKHICAEKVVSTMRCTLLTLKLNYGV